MSNYPIQENPTLTDQFLIWDQANSSWKRAPFSSVLTLFQENTDVSDSSIHLLYPVVDSANITYALPDATAVVSRYVFKRTGTGTGKILFSTVSAQTIDGVTPTNFSLSSEESIILYALGGQWYTENNYKLKLTPSRIAMQELTSGTLSVSGWYTIAETDLTNACSYLAEITVNATGGNFIEGFTLKIAGTASNSNKNETFEITSRTSFGVNNILITNARLARSNVTTSGAKVQIYIDSIPSTVVLRNMINGNIARDDASGLKLIEPTQTDISLCPDGVTSATFLEAGAEIDMYSSDTMFLGEFGLFASDTSSMRFRVPCKNILKANATTITMTYPATGLRFYDITGAQVAVTAGSPFTSFTNIVVRDNVLYFRGIKSAAFASLTLNAPCFVRAEGVGGKITLS